MNEDVKGKSDPMSESHWSIFLFVSAKDAVRLSLQAPDCVGSIPIVEWTNVPNAASTTSLPIRDCYFIAPNPVVADVAALIEAHGRDAYKLSDHGLGYAWWVYVRIAHLAWWKYIGSGDDEDAFKEMESFEAKSGHELKKGKFEPEWIRTILRSDRSEPTLVFSINNRSGEIRLKRWTEAQDNCKTRLVFSNLNLYTYDDWSKLYVGQQAWYYQLLC
ncbi:hypothetical protein AJ80_03940 [Polytolypa hystricis UAMH7299]|uniref:DUF7770 domain-containing protein n=1 Tax=Polytolypa hystricis (strain UAMH7299) TaxID=1447883 RepID=A0A2B7YED7_POLH7|nr:hypothetical protein AJ80_03940 [Polytolypa hystricis UAMH7299]